MSTIQLHFKSVQILWGSSTGANITIQNKEDDEEIACSLTQKSDASNYRHTDLNNGTSSAVPVPLCCLVLMTSTCLTPWQQYFREDQRSPAMFEMI